jgi:activating signal cointegrator complex subunit 1
LSFHIAYVIQPLSRQGAFPPPLIYLKPHLSLFRPYSKIPPLQLHCTIVNTVYRKPRPRGGKRIPFTYTDLLTSPWFSRPENPVPSHEVTPQRLTQSTSNAGHHSPRGPISVDFGTWDVDEVQICEMGSHGPEGEYVCVGKIDL